MLIILYIALILKPAESEKAIAGNSSALKLPFCVTNGMLFFCLCHWSLCYILIV